MGVFARTRGFAFASVEVFGEVDQHAGAIGSREYPQPRLRLVAEAAEEVAADLCCEQDDESLVVQGIMSGWWRIRTDRERCREVPADRPVCAEDREGAIPLDIPERLVDQVVAADEDIRIRDFEASPQKGAEFHRVERTSAQPVACDHSTSVLG
ncbi:hypothetical protein AB0M45_12600 [Nocardia sp. NPDC051787]|uniref:hypothetical protein n=1 Tax=Nocardia sp. NPDC051787 TaxID=3155415 RepID=UPI00343F7F3D